LKSDAFSPISNESVRLSASPLLIRITSFFEYVSRKNFPRQDFIKGSTFSLKALVKVKEKPCFLGVEVLNNKSSAW
jgi:hypothetical protein